MHNNHHNNSGQIFHLFQVLEWKHKTKAYQPIQFHCVETRLKPVKEYTKSTGHKSHSHKMYVKKSTEAVDHVVGSREVVKGSPRSVFTLCTVIYATHPSSKAHR